MPQYAKAAKAKLKHLNRFCEVCEAARIECAVPKPAQTWQVVSGLSKPAGYEGGVPVARHVALMKSFEDMPVTLVISCGLGPSVTLCTAIILANEMHAAEIEAMSFVSWLK